MIKLYICKDCNKLSLLDICNKCLNRIDEVEDYSSIYAKLLEYSRSSINNDMFALVELSKDGSKVKVIGRLLRKAEIHARLRLKVNDDGFEFEPI